MTQKIFLLFLIISALCKQGWAQNKGNIDIIQDPKVSLLVSKHIDYNEKLNGIEGYRIQIFFDAGNNARSKANNTRFSFLARHPQYPAYLIFQQPYFKIRVGNFRTRLDAECFLKQIEKEYQNAFIVKDVINFPDLEL